MRKLKFMSIISALVITFAMAVSLTGCGDDDTSSSKNESSSSSDSSSNDENDDSSTIETMSKEELEKFAADDEYQQVMALKDAVQTAFDAAAKDFGNGTWKSKDPEVVSYTDKDNYQFNIEVYNDDDPDAGTHIYSITCKNGSKSCEKLS